MHQNEKKERKIKHYSNTRNNQMRKEKKNHQIRRQLFLQVNSEKHYRSLTPTKPRYGHPLVFSSPDVKATVLTNDQSQLLRCRTGNTVLGFPCFIVRQRSPTCLVPDIKALAAKHLDGTGSSHTWSLSMVIRHCLAASVFFQRCFFSWMTQSH